MADDFSWIAPATKNIANLFGLNPEAAAKGRNLQSENDLLQSKVRNTDADTALSPYRQKVYEGQANNYNAGANAHNAQAGKYRAETEGLGITNAARQKVSELIASGAIAPTQDGGFAISPQAVNAVGGALAAMDADPKNTMEGIRGLLGNAAQTPRAAAQTRGIAGIFRPDSSTSLAEGQDIEAAKAAAAKDRSVAAAFASAAGRSAAKGQTGPDQMELNRQADAIKTGAEWAMKVPWANGFLDEGQALQLSQAARAANPGLNPQDAIVKFVRDNPGMMKGNWKMLPWVDNKVDFPKGIPTVVPSVPAAAPVAAPAPAPAAPAAGKSLTKQEVLAMPDGAVLTINGTQYRKQGGQLLKVK